IDLALATIDTARDTTRITADYVQLLRDARRSLGLGRLRWGDWAKLGTARPAVRSAAAVAPVGAAAARHGEHPRPRADLHRLIELLFHVAASGLAAYEQHKRERGVMDFVDQEALALHLMRRPNVRAALSGQLDLVLVDEFQDTSPLQLAIFLQLGDLA